MKLYILAMLLLISTASASQWRHIDIKPLLNDHRTYYDAYQIRYNSRAQYDYSKYNDKPDCYGSIYMSTSNMQLYLAVVIPKMKMSCYNQQILDSSHDLMIGETKFLDCPSWQGC